jgi:hypothetical protein
VPDGGPFALVWRRLARGPIDDRNQYATVDDDGTGSVAIPCRGGHHHARVTDGRLVLDDHDVEAELALLALGAELPECLVHAAVWHHAVADAAFLLAWADDVEDEGLRTAREDWEGNYWESWPMEPPAGRVLFGPRLQRALGLAAARQAAADADAGRLEAWFALQRATQTRARRAFVRSLASVDAHRRPDALVPVRIRIDPAADAFAVSGRLARSASAVELVLPATWLWTVWARHGGLAGDRFVVACADGADLAVTWRPTGRPQAEHRPELRPVGQARESSQDTTGARQRPAPR